MVRTKIEWFKLISEEFKLVDKELSMSLVVDNENTKIVNFKDKGVVAYLQTKDFVGVETFYVVSLYLLKNKRSLRALNDLLDFMETFAVQCNCTKIILGANAEFKEDSFNKYLKRKGYSIENMKKEL